MPVKIIASILLISASIFSLHAQSDFEKTFFKGTSRDTFSNESVVISKMLEEYTYTRYGMYDYKVSYVYHAQYLLKDISALQSFSTMQKQNNVKLFEIKRIKPDGKTFLIYEFSDKHYPDDGYEKTEGEETKKNTNGEIPVEDLEVGDIIDYRYHYTYTTRNNSYRKVMLKNGKFDGITAELKNYNPYKYLLYKGRILETSYPVAESAVVLNVPEEIRLVQQSLNCSFGFDSVSSGGNTQYTLLYSNLPAFKPEEYSYYYRYHPVIKYALVQSSQEKLAHYPYQFARKGPDAQQIAALGKTMYTDKKFIAGAAYYLNTSKEDRAFQEGSLSDFFKAFLKTFKSKNDNKTDKLNKLHEYLTNNDDLNPKTFGSIHYAVVLARFCDHIGLSYKMMACLHRYDGEWSDLVSPYELTWGLYLNDGKQELFITDYRENSNIYRREGSLAGTELILFDTRKKTLNVEKTVYPAVPPEDNLFVIRSEMELHEDSAFDYRVTSHCNFTGSNKTSIHNYISSQFDHKELRTPYRFFGLVNYGEIYNFKEFDTRDDIYSEFRRVDSSYRLYIDDYYRSRMLAYLYDEYHFGKIELDSHRIYEDGTFPDDETKDYGYSAYFQVAGMLQAGQGDSIVTMHLGKMITEQFSHPSFRDDQRKQPVYISNLKQFKWETSVALPEGYRCLNLEDFNVEYENDAGRFTSRAVIEDGRLVFHVEKTYKTHYLPKEKWDEMTGFLRTAEAMFGKELLLVRK